jgi:hypothetical protein
LSHNAVVVPERLGEPKRGIRSHAGFLIRKPLNARAGNTTNFRKRAGRHPKRDQKFFPENFTGVHGREPLHRFPGHLSFLITRGHSWLVTVARMKRSEIRVDLQNPHSASLHTGYAPAQPHFLFPSSISIRVIK